MEDEAASLPLTDDLQEDQSSGALSFLRAIAHVSDRSPSAHDAQVAGAGDTAPVGSARFEVRRRVGAGGFGVVYEAFDRERNATVALKAMRRRSAATLYRFKREFRALCELSHENLVQLHELHAEGDAWFFTMELLRGESALAYVRAPAGSPLPFDEERLRAVLAQLARGLSFLHRSGKLHRDVKPSNVLVTEEGRVVLLDFGLVAEIAEVPEGVMGTPAYMAPEQAAGIPLGTAADWYAVGVMLYEALTGRLPKGDEAIAPPRALIAGVPEDLDALCVDLLARAPERRPSGGEVRERLAARGGGRRAGRRHEGRREAPFIGRAAEIAALRDALAAARRGGPVVVLVHGRSGAGKSALVQRFCDEVRAKEPAALVLAGRCFEQESVPFKAVDGIVDELGQKLIARPRAEVEALLPRDVGMLARLFPTLDQLPGARAAARGEADGHAERRRAFAALGELLRRADACPIVAIDDLQWGDLDSVALLLDVLRARVPLLLLASFRTEEAETSPVLRALREGLGGDVANVGDESASRLVDTRVLEVGDLDEIDAEALARALLEAEGRSGGVLAESWVRAIVAEGSKDPFLLTELARHGPDAGRAVDAIDSRSSSGASAAHDPGALLAARVARLPEHARRLLEVVVVAGQPVARAVASRAAYGADPEPPELRALGVLRAGRLVRVQRTHDREELFPYHDRIRETVADGLAEDARRACHERLARALEAAGDEEPERLFFHCRHAGLLAEAARHAGIAAARALDALAFDRAARLYREAIDLATPGSALGALRAGLAEALTGAGRPREAALAYLAAADEADEEAAQRFRRRAAEHLLGAGYLDEGVAALRAALRDAGVELPTSRARALVGLAGLRLRLAAPMRRPRGADRSALARVDACFAAAKGLLQVDPLIAAELQARHLLLARESDDPYRLARALIFECLLRALRLARRDAAVERMLAEARARLDRMSAEPAARTSFDHPHLVGFERVADGITSMVMGDWRHAHERLAEAERILRERGVGTWWELDQARLHRTNCLWMLGEIAELSALVPALVAEARERGNLHVETILQVAATPLVELAADRPGRARAVIDASCAAWPIRPGSLVHHRKVSGSVRVALYEGRARAALAELDEAWPSLLRTGLFFSPIVRFEWRFLRALAALATGDLAHAERSARALARSHLAWAQSAALAVEAAIARRRGDTAAAIARLERVETRSIEPGAALMSAAFRYRRGAWMGGDAGRALRDAAEAEMIARGVRDPERLSAMLIGHAG